MGVPVEAEIEVGSQGVDETTFLPSARDDRQRGRSGPAQREKGPGAASFIYPTVTIRARHSAEHACGNSVFGGEAGAETTGWVETGVEFQGLRGSDCVLNPG